MRRELRRVVKFIAHFGASTNPKPIWYRASVIYDDDLVVDLVALSNQSLDSVFNASFHYTKIESLSLGYEVLLASIINPSRAS